MRYFFIYIIVSAFCSNCCAQNDSTSLIIRDAVRSRKYVNKIIYMDSSINYNQLISNIAKNKKVTGYRDTIKVSMKFSKDEIKYLDSEFKEANPVAWKQAMFENSVMISNDSLKLFTDRAKGPTYFDRQFGRKYFYFSNPIFIRNNSLAIFRLAEMYARSAGYDLLYVYKKVEGEWKQHMRIEIGAW